MLIAWTSIEKLEDAEKLAHLAVERGLAACAQIDGPITSYYKWDGQQQRSQEYRICFKLLEVHSTALEALIKAQHSYSTPEWIVVRAEHVGEKYLSWAVGVSTSSTL
jgi:periplasmic divalent cation tolerance protein